MYTHLYACNRVGISHMCVFFCKWLLDILAKEMHNANFGKYVQRFEVRKIFVVVVNLGKWCAVECWWQCYSRLLHSSQCGWEKLPKGLTFLFPLLIYIYQYLLTHLPIIGSPADASMHPSICLSEYLLVFVCVCVTLSLSLSFSLSVFLSVCLSTCS